MKQITGALSANYKRFTSFTKLNKHLTNRNKAALQVDTTTNLDRLNIEALHQ